jgi:hypothetical protein
LLLLIIMGCFIKCSNDFEILDLQTRAKSDTLDHLPKQRGNRSYSVLL